MTNEHRSFEPCTFAFLLEEVADEETPAADEPDGDVGLVLVLALVALVVTAGAWLARRLT